jgi:hypothetical protein
MVGKANKGGGPKGRHVVHRRRSLNVAKQTSTGKALSDEEKASIIAAHERGLSQRTNSSVHNVGRWQVKLLLEKYEAGKGLGRKSG